MIKIENNRVTIADTEFTFDEIRKMNDEDLLTFIYEIYLDGFLDGQDTLEQEDNL